jgi:plastocyanin
MRGIRGLVAAATIAVSLFAFVLPAQAATLVKGTCNLTWSPRAVTVSKGGTVTWKAVGCGPHTVTSYSSNWSKNTTIATGSSTSRTFKRTGVFKFRCLFHSSLIGGVCSGMCGKVTVT